MEKFRKEISLDEKTIEMLQYRADQLQWSLKKYMEETLIDEAEAIARRREKNKKVKA
jgi:hypothetical protein